MRLYAWVFKSNPYHAADGTFASANSAGSSRVTGTKTLKDVLERTNPQNLAGGVFLKGDHDSHFKELGYTDAEVQEFHGRLEAHTRDATQVSGEKDIADNANAKTRFGEYIRDRVHTEEAIMDHASKTADAWHSKQVERANKSYDQDKKIGLVRKPIVEDGETEAGLKQDSIERAIRHDTAAAARVKDLLFYRKGEADKDVLSTSKNESGAKTSWLKGMTGSTFTPTHKFTRPELKAKGYRPIAGFSSLHGYVGEGEVAFVKMK